MTQLTPDEQREVQARIARFYRDRTDGAAMQRPVPKHDALTGQLARPNTFLRINPTLSNPLLQLAQAKGTESFQKAECEIMKKRFTGLRCDGDGPNWETIESNDRVEALAYSWMPTVSYDLDEVPASGKTERPVWSDDYWKTRWGQTSYRYATRQSFDNYRDAIAAYSQPDEWNGLLASFDVSQLASRIVNWSPAEKYDLTVADESFTLANQQKHIGQKSLGEDGNVESWMGLCHGWAEASVVVPKPAQAVSVVGARGAQVDWYPADVRAMLTLAWANEISESNFAGARCATKEPETFPNGRLKVQKCFDTNPATLHLALGNLIGREHQSFIIDASFDYEVWNQPMYSYEFTYFNPLNPQKTSSSWKQVAVDYDAAFKAQDRFQNPLTRGVRGSNGYDDRDIGKIVGVTATLVYLSEQQPPPHTRTAGGDNYSRVTYTYDLELHQRGRVWLALGGEWHENSHPDFLWLPRKHTTARTSFDYARVSYSGTQSPDTQLTATARGASAYGYVFCPVLKFLVDGSTGQMDYACP